MPTIVIIMVIAIIFINAIAKANQGKKRKVPPDESTVRNRPDANRPQQTQAQRRAAAEAERLYRAPMTPRLQPTTGVSGSSWHCVCGKENPPGSEYCVKCGRKRAERMSGSLSYSSNEGTGMSGSLAYSSSEGASRSGSLAYSSTEGTYARNDMEGRGSTEGSGSMEGRGSTEGRRSTGELTAVQSDLRHAVEPDFQRAVRVDLQHAVEPVTESRRSDTGAGFNGAPQLDGDQYDEHTHDSYDLNGPDAYALDTGTHELPYGLKLDNTDDLTRGILLSEILAKPKALRCR